MYTFGLPDLHSLSAVSAAQREAIGRVIERMIERFEPRLRDGSKPVARSPSVGPRMTS